MLHPDSEKFTNYYPRIMISASVGGYLFFFNNLRPEILGGKKQPQPLFLPKERKKGKKKTIDIGKIDFSI